jgi:hypothetical protein
VREPEGTAQVGPYKAYQSYGPADGDLFFGRDIEGVELARWFQDHPFAVLTAPSGIGKTSLLNARVMPLLEQQHWSTVYCRPREDPSASLRVALCEHMFPDPREEARVARRLLAAIGDETIGLQWAIDWFKVLPLRERVASRLFAVTDDEKDANKADFAALPVLSRALRGSLSCGDVVEHFEAVVAEGAPLGLTSQTPLAEVAHLLEQGETRRLCGEWAGHIGKTDSIADTLDFLDDQWLSLKPGTTGVFLIVDQFEEVFTRLPPGTIRRFMDDVGGILARRMKGTARPNSKPMNIAVSMRKEFLADLLPHLRRLGLRDVTYQLELMTLTAARLAVSQPSSLFRMNFTPAAANRILAYALDDAAHGDAEAVENDLPEEARYSPAVISIYGAFLWQVLPAPIDGETAPPIDAEKLPRLESAFAGYLEESLRKIEQSGASSFAALELLARLVIGGEFRNIVPQRELARRWPLAKDEFERLLELLDGRVKLIRRERRGRDEIMVEIMHERLILPAQSALHELSRQQPMRARLPLAYELLAIAPDDALVTTDPMPAAEYRDCLLRFLNQCDLDPLKAKTLLRSIIAADLDPAKSDHDSQLWRQAFLYLPEMMTAAVKEDSDVRSNALPTGRRLDSALDRLDAGALFDEAGFRRIILGALSDVGTQAAERVRRTFGYLLAESRTP